MSKSDAKLSWFGSASKHLGSDSGLQSIAMVLDLCHLVRDILASPKGTAV